jgi:hypothetical protein
MVEFAINSTQSSSTGFAPFELTYGHLPTLKGLITSLGAKARPGIRLLADKARNALAEAHDNIIAS